MVYSSWVDCGARKRRALITAPDSASESGALVLYERLTTTSMNLGQKIDRGLELKDKFGAVYTHEYD